MCRHSSDALALEPTTATGLVGLVPVIYLECGEITKGDSSFHQMRTGLRSL